MRVVVRTARILGGRAVQAGMAALILCGCATSNPIRYYTLDMAPSGGVETAFSIEIDRLRPSEALARKDILIKKSATQIEYYAGEQWAANVGELVAEKLQAEFGHPVEGRPTVVVRGAILAFEQVDVPDGIAARVKLDLDIHAEDDRAYDKPILKKAYEATVPAEQASPAGVAEALSRALEQVAVDVVKDLAR
jgi:ABC-type uncharacterized transport system auxiliary subunit